MHRFIARALVNSAFYRVRYPDVAESGVDPVLHFAKYWYKYPLRAPNEVVEKAIFEAAPLLALYLRLRKADRRDVVDCLRHQINQLATGRSSLRLQIAKWIMNYIGNSLRNDHSNLLVDAFGRRLGIFRSENQSAGYASVQFVLPTSSYSFRDAKVINRPLTSKVRTVILPGLRMTKYRNATVFGSGQVECGGALCVDEPGADPSFAYVARQSDFVLTCDPSKHGCVLARVPQQADCRVPNGILLTGRCTRNYFHFLVEYMTRGYLIELCKLDEAIPLIVSDDLFPSELEAIRICFPGRSLVTFAVGGCIEVDELYVPSVMTYLPDSPEVPNWMTAAVRFESLRWLKDTVLSRTSNVTIADGSRRRIFLARSNGRNLSNAFEVEQMFRSFGFEIIDTQALSFREQIHLFSSAEILSGPIGAAYANIIFCKAGTKIWPIISPFSVKAPIFLSIAQFSNCEYEILSGEHERYRLGMEGRRQPLKLTHGHYHINIPNLRQVLSSRLPL